MRNRKNTRILFLINVLCVLIGGLTRVLYCWKYPVPARDAYSYRNFIEEWINTGTIPEGRTPPLGSYLMKLPAEHLHCDILLGGTSVNVLLGVWTILVLIKISKEITHSNLIAAFTGIFAATHPFLVQHSCQAIRESSYLFFICVSILFFVHYFKSKYIYYLLLSSFFSAAAFLCRMEALELFIIFGVITLLLKRNGLKKRIEDFGIWCTSYVGSFLLITYCIGVPLGYYKSYSMWWDRLLS